MGLRKIDNKKKHRRDECSISNSGDEMVKKRRKTKKTTVGASVRAVKDLAQGLMKKRSNMNPALLNRNVTFTKPKFLSKRDRDKVIKHKKRDKIDKRKLVKKSEQKNRDEFFRSARYDKGEGRDKRATKTELDKELEMKARLHDREMRQRARVEAKKQEKSDKELRLIWNDYMGKVERKKGMFLPPSQKFKFDFDWKASDDTSEDLNDLYKNKASVAFRFGRGTVAGVDEEEQLKVNKDAWDQLLKNRKTRFQSTEDYNLFRAGKKAIKKKAKLLKKREDMLSRHWSEKQLEEMTKRD